MTTSDRRVLRVEPLAIVCGSRLVSGTSGDVEDAGVCVPDNFGLNLIPLFAVDDRCRVDEGGQGGLPHIAVEEQKDRAQSDTVQRAVSRPIHRIRSR